MQWVMGYFQNHTAEIATTVIGGLLLIWIVWFWKNKIRSEEPNLHWNDETHSIEVDDKSGIPRRYISHTLRIENVGRGRAKDIIVIVPGEANNISLARFSRSPVRGLKNTMRSDTNFQIEQHRDGSKIILPGLPSKSIAQFSWVAELLADRGTESVNLADGGSATQVHAPQWFMRDRDIVMYALRHNAIGMAANILMVVAVLIFLLEIFLR